MIKIEIGQLTELLNNRHSTRSFVSGFKFPKNDLRKIIEDGLQAPSSCNHQMWHFVVIEDYANKKKLQRIAGANEHFLEASVLLVASFQKGWNHSKFAVVQSSAAAIYHMSLSAQLRGYATIWNAGIGIKQRVASLLVIPPQFEIIGILCLGKASQVIQTKPPRRAFSEVVSWEKFKRPPYTIYPLRRSRNYPYHRISVHNNPYAIHDPRKWSWDQIADFRSLAVYAKSPLPYAYVGRRFGIELDAEVQCINPKCKSILEVMSFGGQKTVKICKHTESKEISIAELSDLSKQFIVDRLANEGYSKVRLSWFPIRNGKIETDGAKFNCIFISQVVDAVPDPLEILKSAYSLLQHDGEIIITFRNMLSWYGLYYFLVQSRKQVTNYGPWKPITIFSVYSWIKKSNLEIKQIIGLSPIPSMAGVKITSPFRYICKTIVIRAKLKN